MGGRERGNQREATGEKQRETTREREMQHEYNRLSATRVTDVRKSEGEGERERDCQRQRERDNERERAATLVSKEE